MAGNRPDGPATGPVMVTAMSVDSHNSTEFMVRFVAELDPPPTRQAQSWWGDQISERVKVSGWSSSPGQFSVHVEAERDDLRATARKVLAAVETANASFNGRTPKQRRFASDQAVLDTVMSEYHGKR
ncbi:MAG: hypothetical protein ACRDZT_03830 [Acidimicrobiales bacterium]